ncbi:MAG TPA: SIMPL domain-containing protein [Firmicutes bacterium]|nr:SIMPL domain-containing protein [Bacillota bacterium]
MIKRIVVSGYGEAFAKPDIAEVGLKITSVQPDAYKAQELVDAVTGKLLAELQSLGVPKQDIETRSYALSPSYEWKNDSRVFRGYEVSNALKVKVRDFSLIKQIIQVTVKLGVKEIDYINFKHEDKAALEQEALKKAAVNAIERARAIADGLGVKMGPVIHVFDKSRSYGGRYSMVCESSYMPSPGPGNVVPPDEIKVTAEVEAVLELAGNEPDQ